MQKKSALDVRREEKESFEHAFAEIDPVNVAFAKFRAPGDELLTPAEAIDGRVQYEGSLPVTHKIRCGTPDCMCKVFLFSCDDKLLLQFLHEDYHYF